MRGVTLDGTRYVWCEMQLRSILSTIRDSENVCMVVDKIRRPQKATRKDSSAASEVYKKQTMGYVIDIKQTLR